MSGNWGIDFGDQRNTEKELKPSTKFPVEDVASLKGKLTDIEDPKTLKQQELELEQLQLLLEEELELEADLLQVDLLEAQQAELDVARDGERFLLNSTIPSSSKVAPSTLDDLDDSQIQAPSFKMQHL